MVFGTRNDAFQHRSVLLGECEAGEGSFGNVEIAGEKLHRNSVVEEGDLLVRVARGDGEVERRCERCVGEVEFGELERIDGERRAMGAVEDVEHGAGDGGKEEDEENRESCPEAARAAAAAAVAPLRRRLRAVVRARGVVELRLVRWECRVSFAVRRRGGDVTAVGGWLR